MHDVGGAAGVSGVDMAELQAHVLAHRQTAEAWRVARGTEIAVNIALAEPGVVERALGDLGMQLRQRLVWRLSRRVLVGTDDVGFSIKAHSALTSTLVYWQFREPNLRDVNRALTRRARTCRC